MMKINQNKSKIWVFIINPNAGRGKAGKNINNLYKLLKKYKFRFELVITDEAEHATTITETFIGKGYRRFVAVGGDGTIHEVVNGIMRYSKPKEITFGIIPLGGGNDFVKSVKIPTNLKSAVKLLKKKPLSMIDVGKIEDFYFINSLGIGFDARVALTASKIKHLNGLVRYLAAVLYNLIFTKFYYIGIRTDNDLFRQNILMLSIGNGKFSGGGFQLTPNAILNDGKMNICLVNKLKKIKILSVLPQTIKGTHINHNEVNMIKTRKLFIESKIDLPIYLDGELPEIKNKKEFRIDILSRKIKLVCDYNRVKALNPNP